jgi:DNA-directed RNA polymerase alpha subunit
MLDPTPELPEDTLISRVHFPNRSQNVLSGAGLRTVGEVREASDDMLLRLPDLGKGSVTHLRQTLGLPRTEDGGGLLENGSSRRPGVGAAAVHRS